MKDNIRETLDTTLHRYISDGAARAVAVALIASLRTVEKVYAADQLDTDLKESVLRIVVDLTVDLPSNPFWAQHGGFILPVYTTAVMAWLDGPVYSARVGSGKTEAGVEAMFQAQACRNAVAEIACAVLYKSVGPAEARNMSIGMRDTLLGLKL